MTDTFTIGCCSVFMLVELFLINGIGGLRDLCQRVGIFGMVFALLLGVRVRGSELHIANGYT